MTGPEPPNPEHPAWDGVDLLCERITEAAGILMDGAPESVGVILVVNDEAGPTAFGALNLPREPSETVILNLAEAILRNRGLQMAAVPIPLGEG